MITTATASQTQQQILKIQGIQESIIGNIKWLTEQLKNHSKDLLQITERLQQEISLSSQQKELLQDLQEELKKIQNNKENIHSSQQDIQTLSNEIKKVKESIEKTSQNISELSTLKTEISQKHDNIDTKMENRFTLINKLQEEKKVLLDQIAEEDERRS